MKQKGSVTIIIVIAIVVLALVGGVWYYASKNSGITQPLPFKGSTPTPTSQPIGTPMPFAFSCSQNSTTSLIAYENQQMGIAFCYGADLTISTDTSYPSFMQIQWPQPAMDISYGKTGYPVMTFGIVQTTDTITAWTSSCDFSGPNGEDTCLAPRQSQITEGANSSGLNYVIYSAAFVHNGATIISSNTGPYAYFPFANDDYLIFRAPSAATLPPYVSDDLKTIVNSLVVMPERYTTVNSTASIEQAMNATRTAIYP
jgi:hypothetical protein